MSNRNDGSDPTNDRVLWSSRILAGIIVPVLVAAFLMLYLFPHDTGRLFAWPVRPPMTAMMLGATYLGGAYFFTRVVIARRWHHVSLGFLPVAALCAILGAATAMHWDRFNQGHISFILWVILYFSLPFVIPLAWYLNRRAADPDGAASGPRLSRTVVAIFGGFGVVFTAVGMLLFVVPDWMIPAWPWELTPLTARVVSSMFVLTGLIALGLCTNRRWMAARYILQAQTLAVVLILVAVVFARDDYDWTRPASWFFVTGLALVLAVVISVLVRYGGSQTPGRNALGSRSSRNSG